jgi:transposase/predicted DNA-binding protein
MKLDLNNLPTNPDLLHKIIKDLLEILLKEREELSLKKAELALLKAKLYGKSSEKLKKQVNDLEQQIEESETQIAQQNLDDNASDDNASDNNPGDSTESLNIKDSNAEANSDTKAKNKPKRKPLPAHLPRKEVILNPDAKCPNCGLEDFRTISNDTSEILEYIPASFTVIKTIRPRCACKACEAIVQAPPKSGAIDKGLAGPGLLAHILVQKYCNHLPFYRQSEIYAREDIDLSRSSMASWAGRCARLLTPLIDELKKEIFASSHIHGDDTPIKVLAPGLGKTKTGRIWTYVRDGRAYGDTIPVAVCYFYSPDRKGERPALHLKDFTGVFHADAYGGYDQIYKLDENDEAKILEAACWAHTRRKFYEITVNSDNANIAFETLDQISDIYKIEEEIKGLDPDSRQLERETRSKPLVDKLFMTWKKCYTSLPKKSATAQAINYAIKNEVALCRYLTDGKIQIDNNASERALRSVALGRKNWLFAGSDAGGETAAAIYSLIETAKLNDINPHSYLKNVLERIQDHNSQKLSELLPWNLKLE